MSPSFAEQHVIQGIRFFRVLGFLAACVHGMGMRGAGVLGA